MIPKLSRELPQAAQVVLDSLMFLRRRDGPYLSLVQREAAGTGVDVAAVLMGNSSKTGPSEMGISFAKTGRVEELHEKISVKSCGINGVLDSPA